MAEISSAEIIDALEEVWSSIAALTEDLSPSQWSIETDCPGWDLRDQLSHIIGTERTLDGEPVPDNELGSRQHLRNAIGEMNEHWVQERRPRSGEEVRAEFIEVTTRRLETLRAMSDEQLEVVGWSPIGQVPFRVFLEVRVMDCWMHEQDLRRALARPGGEGGGGERISLHRADQALGSTVGKLVRPPEGSSVAIEVTGPLGGRRRLEIREGRAVAAESAEATSTISLVQMTYLLRFAGRISAAEALAEPSTTIAGDLSLGEAVLSALAVMI